MNRSPEKNPTEDILGIFIAFAFVGLVMGSLLGMFWVVFCHPGSRMVELIPFLRPTRITVTAVLAMSCYQLLARKATEKRSRTRSTELFWVLVMVAVLGAIRYFYGTGDGSTIADINLNAAVRWSMCLGIVMPLGALALLGYRKGKKSDDYDLAGYETDEGPSPIVPPPRKGILQKLSEIYAILMS